MNNQRLKSTVMLAESSVMIGLGTVLSMIALVNLPYGGSITLFSMVPIIVLSYRHGTKWGLFSALAYAFLQMILGLKNLSFGVDFTSKLTIILFDYLIAFTVLGLGGIFRNSVKKQETALVLGSILTSALRYFCHVLSGATVWAGLSIPDKEALSFSFIYNATYMIPETILTVVGVIFLSRVFNLRSERLVRKAGDNDAKQPDLALFFSAISKIFAASAFAVVVVEVFSKIQGEEGFDIVAIKNVNASLILIALISGAILATLFHILAKRVPADSTVSLKAIFNKIPVLAIILLLVWNAFLIYQTVSVGKYGWKPVSKLVVSIVLSAVVSAVIVKVACKKNEPKEISSEV